LAALRANGTCAAGCLVVLAPDTMRLPIRCIVRQKAERLHLHRESWSSSRALVLVFMPTAARRVRHASLKDVPQATDGACLLSHPTGSPLAFCYGPGRRSATGDVKFAEIDCADASVWINIWLTLRSLVARRRERCPFRGPRPAP
jgi:hypothetical protein